MHSKIKTSNLTLSSFPEANLIENSCITIVYSVEKLKGYKHPNIQMYLNSLIHMTCSFDAIIELSKYNIEITNMYYLLSQI